MTVLRNLLIGLIVFIGGAASAAGAAPAIPYSERNPVVTDALTASILDKLAAADLGSRTRLAVCVRDTKRGITRTDINADRALRPASLAKLITSAAALNVLGPDFRFETKLEVDGSIEQGTLYGNVIIRGGGDPSLGPRFQEDPSDILHQMDEWSKILRKQGIDSIVGNIIGYDRRYVYESMAIGWERMEIAEWYSAEVSALNFNENVIDIHWRAGGDPNDRVKYKMLPETEYVVFTNGVRVGPERMEKPQIRYYRFPESNEIRARGRMPGDTELYDFAAIYDPARYTAYLLLEEMERDGVQIDGTAIPGRMLTEDAISSQTLVLDTVPSPPLSELLPIINTDSHNLYAEVLLRELAIAMDREPSFAEGGRALRDWLIGERLHRTGFLMVDGSGLSPVDRATARLVTDILIYMNESPYGRMFLESLATPGEGSLKGRFVEPEYESLLGKLHAKTGYLGATHCLAGYVEHKSGQNLAFTLMLNDYNPEKSREALAYLDSLVVEIQQADYQF